MAGGDTALGYPFRSGRCDLDFPGDVLTFVFEVWFAVVRYLI